MHLRLAYQYIFLDDNDVTENYWYIDEDLGEAEPPSLVPWNQYGGQLSSRYQN